ncbi:MAG: hypothetical protein LBG69_02820 [Zoogloeaceae bacterium]|jgi:hypothetical protein|nr:hypothetical protein [Zoogloeaceae bacterium]
MRIFVFLLLFANLLFFAYTQGYFGSESSPDAWRLTAQERPDRLYLLWRPGEEPEEQSGAADTAETPSGALAEVNSAQNSAPPTDVPAESGANAGAPSEAAPPVLAPAPVSAEAAPVAPPTAAAAPAAAPSGTATASLPVTAAPVSACLRLEALSIEELETWAKNARAAKLQVSTRRDETWWVYIPQQTGRAAAEKKAAELTKLGVTDFFIVNEGDYRFAISLGVFSRDGEEAAQRHLQVLRGKGVRSAVAAPRARSGGQKILEVRGDATVIASFFATLPASTQSRSCL